MSQTGTCRYAWLGNLEYLQARRLQDQLVALVRSGSSPDTLLLLQHPHVYTRGRLSKNEHLLVSPDELKALGVPVHETDRGGQLTYHGPGQLVCYPIIDVRQRGGGPLKYVRELEQVIVETMGDFGITAHTEEGLTGVWTAKGKIAAIGVKISQGVAFHGFAINVNTDLSYYRHIIPCGIDDRPVTSMEDELGQESDMESVCHSLVSRFGSTMATQMVSDAEGLLEMASQSTSILRL